MQAYMDRILCRVVEETLENLAFIFSLSEEEDILDATDASMAFSVAFSGPFSGGLYWAVSRSILPELAANMLGLEEDEISLEEQRDAASEALNIICGNLLPEIADKEAVFNIDPPGVMQVETFDKEISAKETRARSFLSLENGACRLFLQINEED